jgi:hypothetical protein
LQAGWGADDEDRDEGPAARALRKLEKKVAAAAEEAATGGVEDNQPNAN